MCTASDGNHYVVPIGIHKTNIILYNIHVFEKYDVAIPDHEDITWDEFWAICDELCEKMDDEGEGNYPIDLGDQKGWPATQVFENILLGTDPQIYEDFINGIYNVDDITRVMETYTKLMSYVADNHNSRDWYNATGAMMNGSYAMQIMGAWAQPLLTNLEVYPSITHGTAIPWSASTSLQTQIQEYATSSRHEAEKYAKKIVNILKEAGVKGDWNLVD